MTVENGVEIGIAGIPPPASEKCSRTGVRRSEPGSYESDVFSANVHDDTIGITRCIDCSYERSIGSYVVG